MSCCGLSSTGLNNIDANEFTSDNATVFSNLYVGGNTILNNAARSDAFKLSSKVVIKLLIICCLNMPNVINHTGLNSSKYNFKNIW